MYRVTQEIDFCYGHRLLDYPGKCRHLHGHNGRAVVVLSGESLDEQGMLVDFTHLKRIVREWIDENLDHRMILCERDPVLRALQELNEPVFVLPHNPTAENIARLIYEYVEGLQLPVEEVSLWESPRSVATFSKAGT